MASTRRVLGLLAEESVLEDGPAELTEANVRGDITFTGGLCIILGVRPCLKVYMACPCWEYRSPW